MMERRANVNSPGAGPETAPGAGLAGPQGSQPPPNVQPGTSALHDQQKSSAPDGPPELEPIIGYAKMKRVKTETVKTGAVETKTVKTKTKTKKIRWEPNPLERSTTGNNARSLIEQGQSFLATILKSRAHEAPVRGFLQTIDPMLPLGQMKEFLEELHKLLPPAATSSSLTKQYTTMPASRITSVDKKALQNKAIAFEKESKMSKSKPGVHVWDQKRLQVMSQAYQLFLVLNQGGKNLDFKPLNRNAIKGATPVDAKTSVNSKKPADPNHPDEQTLGGVAMGYFNLMLQVLDHSIPEMRSAPPRSGRLKKNSGGSSVLTQYTQGTLVFKDYPWA